MTRVLFIDCATAGFSGDMCLACLADVARQLPEAPFTVDELLATLAIVKQVVPDITRFDMAFPVVDVGGVAVTRFQFSLEEARGERTIHELEHFLDEIVARARLSPQATRFAKATFNNLAQAEMAVHQGHHHHELHFHELSSADTFCDVVGPAFAFDKLGLFDERHWSVQVSPVATGGGRVKIHHGTVPVPAPATSYIIREHHLVTRGGPIEAELLTPTGSALLAALLEEKHAIQTPFHPPMAVDAVGTGGGQKEFPDFLNIARVMVGTTSTTSTTPGASPGAPDGTLESLLGQAGPLPPQQDVLVLETNLDDVTGEDLGGALAALYEAGALDVHVIGTTTKKNRPGHLLRVIAPPERGTALIQGILRETGSLGVRVRLERRVCLDREFEEVTVTVGEISRAIRVKVARDPAGGFVHAKPEFDDLQALATDTGLPVKELRDRTKTAYYKTTSQG